jgi:hypothetical protein
MFYMVLILNTIYLILFKHIYFQLLRYRIVEKVSTINSKNSTQNIQWLVQVVQ